MSQHGCYSLASLWHFAFFLFCFFAADFLTLWWCRWHFMRLTTCSSQHNVSANNAGFVCLERKGRQKGRGRKKPPTYCTKGKNNGGRQERANWGRMLFLCLIIRVMLWNCWPRESPWKADSLVSMSGLEPTAGWNLLSVTFDMGKTYKNVCWSVF